MGYFIALFVVLVVFVILSFLFTILWPLLLVMVFLGAISSYRSYRKRKQMFHEYYDKNSDASFHEQDSTSSNLGSDDVIDVEFSEEEVHDR